MIVSISIPKKALFSQNYQCKYNLLSEATYMDFKNMYIQAQKFST